MPVISPARAVTVATHGLSFTLKSWTVFMSTIYARPLYEAPQPLSIIYTVVSSLLLKPRSCTNHKLKCMLQLQLSLLPGCWLCTLAVAFMDSQGHSSFVKYWNKLTKVTVCGCKQTDRYTHTSSQCNPASVGLAQVCPKLIYLWANFLAPIFIPTDNIIVLLGIFWQRCWPPWRRTCVAPNEMYRSSPGITPFLMEENQIWNIITMVLLTQASHVHGARS